MTPARYLDPHHDPSEAYLDNPTPEPGETVTVTLELPAESGFDVAMLRTMRDGEGSWIEGTPERGTGDGAGRWRFELPCHNRVVNYRFWLGGKRGTQWLTGTGLNAWDPTDANDFRLLTTGAAPRWVPETVWYQIFPDRFATSGRHTEAGEAADWANPVPWDEPIATGHPAMTQLYGGDLDGIGQRLDHLIDLGVGGVYLTPIFPGSSNHRYDATTFGHVDEILGGDDALVRLKGACDRAGLKLMTDLTLNHTGDGHEWFTAAKADPASIEAGFYYFTHHPDEYESWLGVRSLPKLNHASTELQHRFYRGPESAVGRYLAPPFNLAGWRIDVANMTGRYGSIDHNELVRRATRETVASFGDDRWLLGEHFFDPTLDANGDGWHGVMNYAGVARPIASWLGQFSTLSTMMPGPGQDGRDGVAVAASMDAFRAALPWQVALGSMALLSSHDTARWRTMARSDDLALIGFGLLMAVPGSPCFFYGDELGLEAPDNEKARCAMPWGDASRWNTRFHRRYRDLIRMRSASSALAHGGMRWVERSPDSLTFLRRSATETVLVRAARATNTPLVVPAVTLGGGATTEAAGRASGLEGLAGTADVALVDGAFTLRANGPGIDFWRLA